MSKHTVSTRDVTFLLQFLGVFSLLFALVTLFDYSNIFTATTPLTIAGLSLLLLPYTSKYKKVMEIDVDKGKKRGSGGEESRQAKRERIRREKKYA